MKDKAYAKINLSLNVKSRREDGYHELEMIMVPINFFDEVIIEKNDVMDYSCNRSFLAFDEKNTMVKAMNYMKEKYDIQDNFKVYLNKHIPTRAGLAGGSTDAASVIRILDQMYDLKMDEKERVEASVAVGADVYFCLENRPAVVRGIGEKLSFFEVNTDFEILLVKPRAGISTKESFQTLNLELCDHPDPEALKEALENNDYEKAIQHMENSLEEPSFKLCPIVKRIKEELLAMGFDHALMSGSGSTVFALTRNLELIEEASALMKKKKHFVRRVKILA